VSDPIPLPLTEKSESRKGGFMNDAPSQRTWTRPVRFVGGAAGEGPVILSATGEEILRLTRGEFCDLLRDLQIDPELESALRCMQSTTP
jgi:hypothetical protein